jgi:hypothetical protein
MPKKRKGLVVIEKIFKGTRILFKEAVVIINKSVGNERLRIFIYKQVKAFSENQRRDFLFIYNIHLYKNAIKQYLGIFRTNSLFTEAVKDKRVIFLKIYRINYAYDNNI